jgi:hypothetical protein
MRRSSEGAPIQSGSDSKNDLLEFLIRSVRKAVAGYGVPGKSTTMLNYCGIRTDYVDYTVDRNLYVGASAGYTHPRVPA